MRTIRRAGATQTRLVTREFLFVMLATFAYFICVGMVLPVLPRFVEGPLGGGNLGVGFAIGSFAIAAVLARPMIGSIGDREGRRVLMIGGASLVGLSILGYTITNSLPLLVAFRLVAGVGEAGYYVGAASVINDLSPDERRGEAFSYFSLALFGGLAIGPLLGEVVLAASSFDVVWLVAALAAFSAAAVGMFVRETLVRSDEPRERRLVHPAGILPGIVLSTNIWGLASFVTFVPLYALQLGLDGSRFIFAMHSVLVICVRAFGAQIPDRLGSGRSARYALACSAVGFLVMAAWRDPIGLFAGAAIFSLGHSLLFPALMSLAVSGTPISERASVVSTFTAFFDLSFGIGAVSAGAISALLGYRGAFAVASLIALGGFVVLTLRAQRADATEAGSTEAITEPNR